MKRLGWVRRRERLPFLAKRMGIATAVEIGVLRGAFSDVINRRWGGELHLIDPWRHFDTGYTDKYNLDQAGHDKNFEFVVDRFKDCPNVHVVRKTSLEAVSDFEDESIGWVYIDGNHAYEAVKDDLTAWWPKAKSKSMFSGHDYFVRHRAGTTIEVKRAVDEFAAEKRLKINVVGDSWLIIKS